jgi:uncharacterized protein YyaL (SSP411 family)
MRASTLYRIGADLARSSRIGVPIALRDFREFAAAALDPRRRAFVRYGVQDLVRFSVGRVSPIDGETRGRATAAARWLARAHDATRREGLSYGYFPCRNTRGWRAAYPETSGYTIPTFLAFATVTGDEEFRTRALELAHWETRCQLPSGAIAGGEFRPGSHGLAVAFNTGMVLHGLIEAYRHTGDSSLGDSARRAAEFLVGDLDDDGNFRSHGAFVAPSIVKTYTSLCAWPLFLAGELLSERRYMLVARKVGDAALSHESGNGWFAHNCLTKNHAPLLHTIAYTLQGLLELGIITGESKFVSPVQRAIERLLPRCTGFLASRWFADWEPASLTSCLTGSCQLAVVCYRLADHTSDARYRSAADVVLNHVKALQSLDSPDPGVTGAIGGSFPLVGPYMRLGFPQWATKYFVDALLQQETCRRPNVTY